MLPPEVWAVLLYAGQMGDMLTTRYALTKFPATIREANPLAKRLLGWKGWLGLQLLKSILGGTVLAGAGFALNNEWFWLAATTMSWFPVFWNAGVLRAKS